jgi:hypothetical protein
MIVARYVVPGISKIGGPCRRYGLIRSVRVSSQIARAPELTLESPWFVSRIEERDHPVPSSVAVLAMANKPGRACFCMAFPGTTYLATITRPYGTKPALLTDNQRIHIGLWCNILAHIGARLTSALTTSPTKV